MKQAYTIYPDGIYTIYPEGIWVGVWVGIWVHDTWYEIGVPNGTWLYPPAKVPCYPC